MLPIYQCPRSEGIGASIFLYSCMVANQKKLSLGIKKLVHHWTKCTEEQ
jgi:hypothetical protein